MFYSNFLVTFYSNFFFILLKVRLLYINDKFIDESIMDFSSEKISGKLIIKCLHFFSLRSKCQN